MEKLDYKKQYKDLYLPPKKPVVVDVPEMFFLMVDGWGAPEEPSYQEAVSLLYSVAFTIKMSKRNGSQPEGYFDYVVPPLEGLWNCSEEGVQPVGMDIPIAAAGICHRRGVPLGRGTGRPQEAGAGLRQSASGTLRRGALRSDAAHGPLQPGTGNR